MTLRLLYKADSRVPVEVEGVTPEAVRDRSLAEIERLHVFEGNRRLPLAELFDVSGEPSDGRMSWEGDLRGVHWIGARMAAGEMHIRSTAGRHVGSKMKGGEIHVHGDVGDCVGAEMGGGLIRVHGHAGHLVGAAYRGSVRGATGGVILVDGNAGNEIGHAMRRGLVAVGGNAGDLAAFNMLAGSVLVFGDSGIRPGAGMRRGTLTLLGPQPPALLPTFVRACCYQPVFVRLLLRTLQRFGFQTADELLDAEYELYSGDTLEGGRGEILLRAAD